MGSMEGTDDHHQLHQTAGSLSDEKKIRNGGGGGEEEEDMKYGLKLGLQGFGRDVAAQEYNIEKFLLRLKNRLDVVGLELPTVEVRFENVRVEAEAYPASRALSTLYNVFLNKIEELLNYLHVLPSRKKRVSILKDVNGIIKPSRMVLLLGPPSSGKTTLLQALAGNLPPNLQFSGNVTYNGHEMNEFVPQRTASYISQHDLHLAELTVRETLAFAARCQGVGYRYEMLVELLRRENEAKIIPDSDIDVFMKAVATEGQKVNAITDYVLKVLGLEACADTMVGNEIFRGISGGERKRLTIGEMLVGPASTLFMDEISTGLDSATTFQILNSIRHYIHIFNGTGVISLLQPASETYELFDDIILLSCGQIVYQGPCENALEFFEYMGFKCPKRKSVVDFLQEVTSKKDQKQYWAHNDHPYQFVTAKEFSEAFQSFHVGNKIGGDLSTPFDKAKSHPSALATRKYGVRKMELLKACFSREYLLMKRNSFVYILKIILLAINAIIAMTVFLQTEMHRHSIIGGVIYMGALLYAVMLVSLNGMADLIMTVAKLPVFYKQRDFLFYPSWAYSFPQWILKIPITFAEAAVWVSITYYGIGCDPSVERLFRQCFILLLVSQMAVALFSFLAAVGRTMHVAYSFATFVILAFLTLGGFLQSHDSIKSWWIWGYWISPLMYGQNAILVNEFLGENWSEIPIKSTVSLGVQVLESRGFFHDAYWYWIGVGVLIGFTLVYNFCFTMALAFLNPFSRLPVVIAEDSESDKHNGMRGASTFPHYDSCRQKSTDIGDAIRKSKSHKSSHTKLNDTVRPNHNKKGMILPFEPHCITFDEVKYSVDMPQEMKNHGVLDGKLVILKGVSGAFRPGVLTALMGVSGSGKTSLLDVLAGRKTTGYTEGIITISGYPKKQGTFARIAGYCEQNDIHSPHVTVYESLVYSAWLRLSTEIDVKTRMMFIEEVIDLVELNQLRQALVGLPGATGLSTEQRKRLTIAVELVANPSIIFMDEPTSGLDARATAIVMRTVRNAVDTGRTVVCTIHQPSINLFECFDELFLLKRGGQEIYFGPLGHRSSLLIKYFEGIEGVNEIRDGYNPATWMLEITTPAQESALGIDFAAAYKNSQLYKRNKAVITELSSPTPGSEALYFPTQYSQSFFTQCKACIWKQHWSYWRNPAYNAIRFIFATVVGLLYGTMFWKIGSIVHVKRIEDLFNALTSVYCAVFIIGLQSSSSVQPVVAVERTVFYRERAAGMYSALPYAFAQVLIELPYIFVQTVLYATIVYLMAGCEWTAAKFFWYVFFVYFTIAYFTFHGMMSVGITPNEHIGYAVSNVFYGMWNLFSGYIIPGTLIPMWWRWYYWACPLSWTMYGLVASQYGDVKNELETGQTVEEFLRTYYGFEHEFLGVVAAVVVGFGVFFAYIFATSIKILNFQRR